MYKEDTIAAVATAPGEGGVAIIRVSGRGAEQLAAQVFVRAGNKSGDFESHKLYFGKIRSPGSARILDEVLLTVMRKPHSYTGEDVVEIHCHGGAVVVRQVLGLLLSLGARQAEPGEFTKRAFLNSRLDLAQAEAVLELIQARTDKSAALALGQMSGELSKWVYDLREELLDLLVQVEAAIDFPEEEIELLQRHDLTRKISDLIYKISYISNTYEFGRLFREGARVCICGRPNVGKSSLLNALLGEERVIVTPVPGTTRDVIEESINFAGLPVVLWDTAGIRDTDDQVEKLGVTLSRQHMERADAVLVVLDGSAEITEDDRALLQMARGKKSLIVINKCDLPQTIGMLQLANGTKQEYIVSISARTSAGLDRLITNLRELLIGSNIEPPVVVTNLRHKSALVRTEQALGRAATALANEHAPEFVAVDLNEVGRQVPR